MNTKYKTPILHIEDDPADVAMIRELLKDAGLKYELHHTETLFEGLALIEKHSIDLVLLDLNLPDSSGFRTISTFLERTSNVPVIVITHTQNEIIGNQAVKAGAQDFLIKSQLESRQFGRAVRYALQRAKVKIRLEETARELEIHKKRFLEVQQMAHFGTWEMDIVTNRMNWSDELYRIFSFPPGSISPTLSDYLSYVHVEDKRAVEDFFEKLVKTGARPPLEHRILLEGTNVRYLTIQGKVQAEEFSGKILLVGNIQDITERKRSEKLIIEKNISSKTAKIQEEVLSDLSFQIRTPLSSIVNLLFLLENTEKSRLQGNYLRNLKVSVDDLALSVNNLLNFSVMVSDNVKLEEEEFNIREFLQGTRNVVGIKAENSKISMELETDDSLPGKIISDAKKLTQVLYNLTDYAIKHSGIGGKVTLTAKMQTRGSTGNLLTFSLKNSGEFISGSRIRELLEVDKLLLETDPQVLEEPEKKKDLGIAIASKLLKNMGGNMEIRSMEGEGTEFRVGIPVRLPRQTTTGETDKPEMPLKILLVEDHFLNQMATRKVLTSWSDLIRVDIAENGLVAIEKFREYGYDLILMDIQMPVMNGLDAARKIREFSNVPILALTANSNKQEQDKCLQIGMNDYLSKPFKPKELYARIMSIVSLVPQER